MNIETANRLLQYRKENNLSQEELAEKIGVSRQAVSKWERAEASPDTDNLIRLAEIYGVSLDEMLTGKKTQAEPEPEPQPEPQTDESNTLSPNRRLTKAIPGALSPTLTPTTHSTTRFHLKKESTSRARTATRYISHSRTA